MRDTLEPTNMANVVTLSVRCVASNRSIFERVGLDSTDPKCAILRASTTVAAKSLAATPLASTDGLLRLTVTRGRLAGLGTRMLPIAS